jgi:hypothetical protein
MEPGGGNRRTWKTSVGEVEVLLDGPAEGPWADAINWFVTCADPGGEQPQAGHLRFAEPVVLPQTAPLSFNEGLDFSLWTTPVGPIVRMGPARLAFPDANSGTIDAPEAQVSDAVRWGLPYLLSWILGAHDVWLVHGAAVVPPGFGDNALLITGSTGSGKSTSAACALAAGWPVIADDMVVIRSSGNGLELTGVRFPIRVPTDLSGSALSGPSIGNDLRQRRAVGVPGDVPLLRGWRAVGGIAVVGHGSEQETRIERISSTTALSSLWPAAFASLFSGHFRTWFSLAAELSRRDAFDLRLGNDPDHRVASTIEAFSSITAS